MANINQRGIDYTSLCPNMLFEEASVGYGKNFSGGTVGGLLVSGTP